MVYVVIGDGHVLAKGFVAFLCAFRLLLKLWYSQIGQQWNRAVVENPTVVGFRGQISLYLVGIFLVHFLLAHFPSLRRRRQRCRWKPAEQNEEAEQQQQQRRQEQ